MCILRNVTSEVLAKQERQIKSTTTTATEKRTVSIDVQSRLDLRATLSATQVRWRGAATSAKQCAHKTKQLSGFTKSPG